MALVHDADVEAEARGFKLTTSTGSVCLNESRDVSEINCRVTWPFDTNLDVQSWNTGSSVSERHVGTLCGGGGEKTYTVSILWRHFRRL